MTWLLLLYLAGIMAIAIADARRTRNFDAYVLAGRRRSGALVAASLLASVVGASATVGVAGLACKIGAPAFWWLGSGAVGLIACGLFLAPKLREMGICTLADMAQRTIGAWPRRATALIVVVGWTGIVGAQFVAAAKILGPMTGWSYNAALALAAAVIAIYCILGGQASVMKTDALQLALMLASIFLCAAFLWARTGPPPEGLSLALLNPQFPPSSLWYFMIVVGSGFLVGPDVFARLFTARSGRAARGGAVSAGLALALVSAAIVSIGLWARHFAQVPEGQSALPYVLAHSLPPWLGGLLSLGLLSAIVSSADTCLMSAASTAEHDLLGASRVGRMRWIVAAMALASALVAGLRRDIIDNMLLAYSLFNCGVIPPIALAAIAWPRRRIHPAWAVAAIVLGGALGLGGKLADSKSLTMAGMGLSMALSLGGFLASGRKATHR